ncbi:hypothetical protein JL720_15870 [Aureococcus anophagefferens]|nr:hypothetical protein JL720_15870 [Aureococcus anophagefferens]
MALSLGGALDVPGGGGAAQSLELGGRGRGGVRRFDAGDQGLQRRAAAHRLRDVARVFQGQFVQGIFQRLDVDGDGERRGAAPGAPNEKTEELLETFPFRRRSHAFCSPGSCVCFPWSHEDASSTVEPGFFGGGKAAKSFPASCLRCDAGVHLLESTGEGIHVYDFAHRYFESKITTRDEFTHAIEYHSRRVRRRR